MQNGFSERKINTVHHFKTHHLWGETRWWWHYAVGMGVFFSQQGKSMVILG